MIFLQDKKVCDSSIVMPRSITLRSCLGVFFFLITGKNQIHDDISIR